MHREFAKRFPPGPALPRRATVDPPSPVERSRDGRSVRARHPAHRSSPSPWPRPRPHTVSAPGRGRRSGARGRKLTVNSLRATRTAPGTGQRGGGPGKPAREVHCGPARRTVVRPADTYGSTRPGTHGAPGPESNANPCASTAPSCASALPGSADSDVFDDTWRSPRACGDHRGRRRIPEETAVRNGLHTVGSPGPTARLRSREAHDRDLHSRLRGVPVRAYLLQARPELIDVFAWGDPQSGAPGRQLPPIHGIAPELEDEPTWQ
ncbi:hypothetical protein ACVWXU_001173 [Streptomyces sp. TE33382]